jgi:two-component SAPR family response regulator
MADSSSIATQKRIMLVDDEEDILFVCSAALSKFKVDSFSNPEQALEFFRHNSNDYDLVLTDVRMPNLSGFELAKGIRDIRPDITILFMSAFEITAIEEKDIFPSLNISEIISKPVSLNTLERIITQHIKVEGK